MNTVWLAYSATAGLLVTKSCQCFKSFSSCYYWCIIFSVVWYVVAAM